MTDAAIQGAPARAPQRRPRAPWQVWRDTAGRLSWLRIAALAFLLRAARHRDLRFQLNLEAVGARPLNNVIHRAGFWTLIFLMTSLAITPLRRIARFNQLVDVRRMIGVGAFVYAACHISLYVADQMFDLWKVASEIVLRLYLTIGFTALLGLAALAITSTDGMVRRMGGKRWQRLHNIIYGIGLLALIHYFQQTKADESGADLRRLPVRLDDRLSPPDQVPQDTRRAAGLDAARAQRCRLGTHLHRRGHWSQHRVPRAVHAGAAIGVRYRFLRPQFAPARLAGARRGADRRRGRCRPRPLRQAPRGRPIAVRSPPLP